MKENSLSNEPSGVLAPTIWWQNILPSAQIVQIYTLFNLIVDQRRCSSPTRKLSSHSQLLLGPPASKQDQISHDEEDNDGCYQYPDYVSGDYAGRVRAGIEERVYKETLSFERDVG
jgi:hypothetical protein